MARVKRAAVVFLVVMIFIGGGNAPSEVSAHAQGALGEELNLSAAEIAALVNECGVRTTRMWVQLFDYKYTQTNVEYEIDKRGQVARERTKAYEVTPVRIGKNIGLFVSVQVSEDGVPFSAERIARERERAVKNVTEAEEKAAQAEARPTTAVASSQSNQKFWQSSGIRIWVHGYGFRDKSHWWVRPTLFLRAYDFYAPRRTTLGGREAILLSFRPRPGYDHVQPDIRGKDKVGAEEWTRVLSQLGGRIWIDAAEKVVMRLEAAPVSEMSAAVRGANVAPDDNIPVGFEFARLHAGTWVPKRNWYTSLGRESFFWKASERRAYVFDNYKLFTTSVESEKLDAPQARP
ncbi:MAG: hypothetical protein H0V27_07180 [Pyrinomonadaceae bacterium]|nr:hypothetical protein [Pyrinomonadaceae bacterium]